MKKRKRRIKRRIGAKRGRPRRERLTVIPSRFKIGPVGRMRGILADSITLRTVNGETYVEVNAAAAGGGRGKGCRILYEPGDQSVACLGSCPCPILVKRRRDSITFSCGPCEAETLPGDLGGAEWESP